MRLFSSDQYTRSEFDLGSPLSTPLGSLERQYFTDLGTTALRRERGCYRHLSENGVVCRWTTPRCVLEELFVALTPSASPQMNEIECRAVLVRLEALASGVTFDARLSWLPGFRWTEGIGVPGEGLEARSWFDNAWDVTVGTEDSEYLTARSRVEKWMPRRLAAYFEEHPEDVLQIERESFSIHIPELESGERCQFQFVIAWGPRREDESTLWLAVDQRSEELLAAADCH